MKKIVLGMSVISSVLLVPSTAKEYHGSPTELCETALTTACQKQRHVFVNLHFLLEENGYKSHFLGMNYLLGKADIFEKAFFLNAIRKHPYYNEFSQTIKLTERIDSEGKNHFYLKHPGGTRHFTIEKSLIGNNIAYRLENATIGYYPTLESFIRSTLG